MLVNLTTLAKLLGVTRPTVRARIDRGMPYESRGSEGKDYVFDTVKVLDWHVTHAQEGGFEGGKRPDVQLKELRRRKLLAEAETFELKAAEMKSQVVTTENALETIREAVEELRSHFLMLASRVAPKVAGMVDEEAVKAGLEDEVDRILRELTKRFTQGDNTDE